MLGSITGFLAQSDMYDSTYYDSYYSAGSNTEVNGAAAAGLLAFFAAYFLFILVVAIFYVVCTWKIFTKAGKPGWASIIPIYNQIVLLEIVNKPVWWIALFFIPFANIVVSILLAIELARVFGKSDAFAILLILVPIVGYPMLAFDKNVHYKGVAPTAPAAAAPISNDTATPSNTSS